jgi:hypothetical protein
VNTAIARRVFVATVAACLVTLVTIGAVVTEAFGSWPSVSGQLSSPQQQGSVTNSASALWTQQLKDVDDDIASAQSDLAGVTSDLMDIVDR